MEEFESGFNAMGKPIPFTRKQAAYDAAVAIGVKAEHRFPLINGVAEQLERDKPYEAMRLGMKYVDITGYYRIMAHLLTGAT